MGKRFRVADRYQVEDIDRDLLGRGGMGDVYRATDAQTGETVAVKALNPDVLARDPELLERFQREGEALRRLNHPNIVHRIAACEENERHYLVMEYVGGGSLDGLLKKEGRLSPARAIEIGLDLADALTRAHRLGILHRDLKPANVLLALDGTPRLADFGIAHVAVGPQLTQTGMLIGTVDYLSPEACQGEPLDERADIWALGVLLFQILSGRLPFEGQSLTAKLTAILTQPVPDLAQLAPDVPDALADLVYRMLEKDRCQRIPSVRLVGTELEALLKGREPARVGGRFVPPTPSPEAPRHNLPAQTTPFVGRQAELAELARLLTDPEVRLVTVAGLGGMGKTRLALEAGTAAVPRFTDGVFLVSLDPLQSAGAVLPAVAQAIGFTFYEGGEPRRQLLDYLRRKDLLLILDNCEHLLDGDGGAGGLAADILQTAPMVKILTTSRLRLGLHEEHLFHLAGIDSPEGDAEQDALQSSAVRLFLQGAQRACPGFELEPGNVQPVATICRLVQGMPLAILLAAAWVELLAPTEIATELQTNIDLLQTEQQSFSVRQRSVRAVFDYSWSLLTERERQVFVALSVFRGGFTREAAQEITGASLRDLMGLTSKSLIQRTPAGRYGIHELLRQYAAEQLQAVPAEEAAIRDRHAAYFAGFLKARAALLHTSSQKAALAEIATEIENARLAWDRAIARSDRIAIDLSLESLAEFFRVRGWLREAQDAFARAAEMLDGSDDDPARLALARVQAQRGMFCEYLGEDEEAGRFLNASLSLARALDSRRDMAVALSFLGGSASLYGAIECNPCLQALAIFGELEDCWGVAITLRGLAWGALHQGDYPLAVDRFQASVDAFRGLDDSEGLAESLGGRGYTAWIMGEYERAQKFHEEMLAVCSETGDRRGTARAIADLAIDACGMQQFEEALRLWRESLVTYMEIGDRWGMADVLGDMGEGCNMLGRYAEAAEYAEQSLDLKVKRRRGLADWELRVRGVAALGMGDLRAASDDFRQALQSDLVTWYPARALHVLASVAALLAAEGERERALELLALVFHDRRTWQWAKDSAAPLFTTLRAELPANVIAAAEARGRASDLRATVEELLAEGYAGSAGRTDVAGGSDRVAGAGGDPAPADGATGLDGGLGQRPGPDRRGGSRVGNA
jgi:predicted ATPase